MPSIHLIALKGHLLLISVGITLLLWGIFGSQDQPVSWAAPEQNPLMQTIPTRIPTAEPEPTRPPTAEPELTLQPTPVNPSPDPPAADNDNDDEIPGVPVGPPEQNGDSMADQPFPSGEKTGQDSQGNNNTSLATPFSKESTGEDTRPLPAVEPGFETSNQTSSPVINPTDLESSSPPLNPDEEAGAEQAPLTERPLPRPQSNLKLLVDEDGSLIWLYAFGLGVILILTGIFLVKRA